MRRWSAWVVVVLGAGLIAAPIGMSLFSRASAAEKLSSAVRPSMTSQGLGSLQSDFDIAFAAGDQFIQKTIPAVASALHESTPQFSSYVGTNFPNVATGVQRWYAMSDDARRDISTIEAHRTDFYAADAIPTSSIPLTTGVWGFIALGAGLVIAGVFVLRTRGRAALTAALALGLAAIIIPLALSFPHKSSETDSAMKGLSSVLSRQEVDTLKTNLGVVKLMVPELTGKLIPGLEQKLKMTPDDFNAFVSKNFPAVATGLAQFQPILDRMSARVGVMDAGVPLFSQTSKIPFNALPWLFILPGAIVALAAGAPLVRRGAVGDR